VVEVSQLNLKLYYWYSFVNCDIDISIFNKALLATRITRLFPTLAACTIVII